MHYETYSAGRGKGGNTGGGGGGGGGPAMPLNVTFFNQGGARNADDSNPSASNSSTLGVQWDEVIGAASYNIYRSKNGGPYTFLANVAKTTWSAHFSGNTMTVDSAPVGGAQPIYPGVRFSAPGLLAETMVYDAWQSQSTSGQGSTGTYPINRSQTLGTIACSACYYVDQSATNAVNADKARPDDIYDYNITAVDASLNESLQSNNMVQWAYHNGFTNWGKGSNNGDEVSFGSPFPNTIYNSTAGSPQGGPFSMEYQINGGFQPSASRPQNPQWTMEVGWAKYIIFDFNPGASYTGWALNIGVVSGTPEGDTFGDLPQVNIFNGTTTYGPIPQANTWGRYVIPIALLGYGRNSFTGSLGDGLGGSGSQLSVATVGPGLFGAAGFFDNASLITGTGLPVPLWAHSKVSNGSGPGGTGPGGKWTMWGAPYTPGVHPPGGTVQNAGPVSSDGTWMMNKTQCYKFSIFCSGGPTQQSYMNNLGFIRVAP